MTSETQAPWGWSGTRWLGAIAAACALQLALLFWVGDARPARQPAPGAPPFVRLYGGGAGDWLSLMDPTLFALPHRQGFSGPGWLLVPPRQFEPYVWSNAPDWLELPVADLGAPFQQFVEMNSLYAWQMLPQPAPELTQPEPAQAQLLPARSTFRLADDLAQRRLLVVPELPSWPNSELLTNTIVRLVVNAEGQPVSLTLLVGSGKKEADEYALAQARAARFEPVARPATALGLSWGELIFDWFTLPPATNAPDATNQ